MKNFSKEDKCKQAGIGYLVLGVIYMVVGSFGMPPHDYGLLAKGVIEKVFPSLYLFLGDGFPYGTALWSILITLGILFLSLSYFIYKGYGSVIYVLTMIYLVRTIFVGRAAILDFTGATDHSGMMYIIFPLVAIVFYLLIRSAFNLKP
jgi:hypothetical protein